MAAGQPGFGAVAGAVTMLVAFTIVDSSGWWTAQTVDNVLYFTAILGCVALGEALVVMSEEIDLAVGSVYGLGGITFIMLQGTLGVPGAVVAGLAFCGVIGLLQGLAVMKGGLSSMIVTLGGLFFVRGILYVWTGGNVRSLPAEAREHWLTGLLGGELFGIEAATIWVLLLLAVLTLLLRRMRFGNRLLAAGGDVATARARGVDVVRVKTTAFVLCSLLAGFAGILTLADEPQTHVTLGEFMELDVIAAVVIGGCLLSGGRGSLVGALLGAFIVTGVRYELIALGAPSSWFISFVGVVLILAMISNQRLARWAGHRA